MQSDKSFHVVYDPEDDDEKEELLNEPPPQDLAYHRSGKDKLKLIILPPLYFTFMVIAAVVVFFTIDALAMSYRHKVRSIHDITVEQYHTIGIAMFPKESVSFHLCEFQYADSLYRDEDNWSELEPSNQICEYKNVTFFSCMLNRNRTAMVFNGPTLVHLKQNLAIHFSMNTDDEKYSSIEYLLLGHWGTMLNQSSLDQETYLAEVDQDKPLFSVPAGFRTSIKMSYTVYNLGLASRNRSNFDVHADLTSFNNEGNDSVRPLLVLFEWKGDTYEYVTEILSTTAWNTLGALAGMFVAIIKVGEYSHRWIKRMRRERKKKFLKAAAIEEQHYRKLDLYWKKKMERQLNELASRFA